MNLELLKNLCAIPATAGDETRMTEFVLKYFELHSKDFKTKPVLHHGDGFQDMVIAVFGKPRTAIFAHMDTVGYCTAHGNKLIKIGHPKAPDGTKLVGNDAGGEVTATLHIGKPGPKKSNPTREPQLSYKAERAIAPGTPLTYAAEWKETKRYVKCSYLDNRVGVWNALHQAHTMEQGALVFTTYEETGGGSAQAAGRFLQEQYDVRQALISDVTLLSPSIKHEKGVAISMRDRGIPRQSFVRRIITLAEAHRIPFQLEVENAGGSDGTLLQASSWPWDWCFIGPPEGNYHQPGEKVAKSDLEATLKLYELLLKEL